jgi:hypothetical protein
VTPGACLKGVEPPAGGRGHVANPLSDLRVGGLESTTRFFDDLAGLALCVRPRPLREGLRVGPSLLGVRLRLGTDALALDAVCLGDLTRLRELRFGRRLCLLALLGRLLVRLAADSLRGFAGGGQDGADLRTEVGQIGRKFLLSPFSDGVLDCFGAVDLLLRLDGCPWVGRQHLRLATGPLPASPVGHGRSSFY